MTFQLRDYQEQIIREVKEAFQGGSQYVCATAPTGAGKTVISFALVKDLVEQGKRVLFVVNREELVFQTVDKFHGIRQHLSILKAGYETMYNPKKQIQIAMLQTWHARKIAELEPDYIFIDEIHDGWGAKRVSELLETYPDTKVLGLTATPIDEKGFLLPGFNKYIQTVQVCELIEKGHLVQPEVYAPVQLDLSEVRTTGNDYNEKDLDKILTQVKEVENVVRQYQKFADGLKAIVFANTIEHAEALKGAFLKSGHNAEVIHSKLQDLKNERKRLIGDFKNGTTPILINVGILTTGFDEGSVECVLLARPTKILRLYIQIAGRGLRTHPGKEKCLFLDCANIVQMHGYPDDIRIFEHKPVKVNTVRAEYKLCPQCEFACKINVSDCPACGYKFTPEDAPEEVSHKEAEKLEQLRNLQKDCYLNVVKEVEERGYKKGYAFFLMKDIARIKPPTFSAKRYYGKVSTLVDRLANGRKTLKKCPKCNYFSMHYPPFFTECPKCGHSEKFKPQWLIFKLKDHYRYKGELNCVGGKKEQSAN